MIISHIFLAAQRIKFSVQKMGVPWAPISPNQWVFLLWQFVPSSSPPTTPPLQLSAEALKDVPTSPRASWPIFQGELGWLRCGSTGHPVGTDSIISQTNLCFIPVATPISSSIRKITSNTAPIFQRPKALPNGQAKDPHAINLGEIWCRCLEASILELQCLGAASPHPFLLTTWPWLATPQLIFLATPWAFQEEWSSPACFGGLWRGKVGKNQQRKTQGKSMFLQKPQKG